MKIAIFGLARSGLSAFNFISKQPEHECFLVNQGDPETWGNWDQLKERIAIDHCVNQDAAHELMGKMDLIILSPGIPREHEVLKKAHENHVSVISEIEFAYNHSDIPVIGITGTNGKTTTTTMIGEVLNRGGKKAFVCGNIGRPYSDLLLEKEKYDYAVVELSSFQLESINKFHPHIALLLNITNNHTERYSKLSDYQEAKYNIFSNQTSEDYVLINDHLPTNGLKGQLSSIKALSDFDYSKSKLVGEHNKQNFYCAYKVCEFLKIPNLKKLFQEFINDFKGVEFRLQYICEYNGLNIYNDGKSTNDAATLAAVNAFKNSSEDLFLILGGQPRTNSTSLGETLNGQNIKKIFVFGKAKNLLEESLKSQFQIQSFENLVEIFEYVKKMELKGNLLFSPAFPSFDQYRDYVARGGHFTELALKL